MIGPSSNARIDRLVYVAPAAYDALGTQDRHEVARVVGRVVRRPGVRGSVMLVGPGRWGTSTPTLGVPVSFAEIRGVSALCEIVHTGQGVVPEVPLGSHFFNDLVESNMLYLALDENRGGRLDDARLRGLPNRLAELNPDDARLASVVHVVDFPTENARGLWLNANCVEQEVLCYFAPSA